jgi:hypothetical protein
MAGSTYIEGSSRKYLVRSTGISVSGSVGLTTIDGGQFCRYTGFFSGIGSMTVRVRFGIGPTTPPTFYVSSTFVVNSGTQIFDLLNYGESADWGITAANSQVFACLIVGEPTR